MNLLNYLGIGTVAATKQTNTDTIMVSLKSMSPQTDGRTVAQTQEIENKTKNADGEEIIIRGMSGNAFPAEWRSMGDSNRISSPDVREGSQVAIYQITGSNNYYWTTFGVNAKTFRLEHVVMGWSANPGLSEDTPFNIDNFYTMVVSTIEGSMALRTTQMNNEKTTFELKVDAMNGQVMIAGGQKNFAVWDDVQHSFTYSNVDGSVFSVNKKKITAVALDSVSFQATEQLNILTKFFNLECKQINVKAESAEFRIPKTKWIGDVQHIGDEEQTGNFTQDGNTTSTGTIHADVDVTSLTSLNYHVHPGIFPGPATTQIPVPMVTKAG